MNIKKFIFPKFIISAVICLLLINYAFGEDTYDFTATATVEWYKIIHIPIINKYILR